jgi:hypothetical protein
MKARWFLVLLLGLILFVAPVQADTYLDFNMDGTHPATANISFAGGGAPLIGVDISVDSVTGFNTPLHAGFTADLTGGILNFTTGNFIGFVGDTWYFGPGGSIALTWSGRTLMWGDFIDAQVIGLPGQTFKVTIASFFDEKFPRMLDFFGLPTDVPYLGNLNLSFYGVGVAPGDFDSTSILSGDITNKPVPEPMSLILLGCGLVGFGFYRRFRKP